MLFPDGRAPAFPKHEIEPPAPLRLTGTALVEDGARIPPDPEWNEDRPPTSATATDPEVDLGRCGVGIILRKAQPSHLTHSGFISLDLTQMRYWS